MGVGNTYAALIYNQGVRGSDLSNIILPGPPCWDARNPGEVDEIRHFLELNQQIRLEVSKKFFLLKFRFKNFSNITIRTYTAKTHLY